MPVLLQPVLDAFSPIFKKKRAIFVDGTLGLAGHSIAIAREAKTHKLKLDMIGFDKDESAIDIARNNIEKAGLAEKFTLVQDDFNNFRGVLDKLNIDRVDAVLLDLGVSSMQLDDKSRGFSFTEPKAELDMRMDRNQARSAYSIVNEYSQNELERLLKAGEEWHFRKIAAAIVSARKLQPIRSVGDLLVILEKVLPKRYSRTHFATDTFRALRLEVNDEVSKLDLIVEEIVKSLEVGGRLAIITFHSLEDRIVKDKFRQLANPCTCPPKMPHCACGLKPTGKIITKKPISADEAELQENPRARSAKLRVIEKIVSE